MSSSEGGMTGAALKRVKADNAHKYAADQYGVDTTIPDDVLCRIINLALTDGPLTPMDVHRATYDQSIRVSHPDPDVADLVASELCHILHHHLLPDLSQTYRDERLQLHLTLLSNTGHLPSQIYVLCQHSQDADADLEELKELLSGPDTLMERSTPREDN